MRISFFNELDSYALAHKPYTKSIIEGVSLDERIGDYYNNSSFGYGGIAGPRTQNNVLDSVPQNRFRLL